jgi:hypothetical protein
MGAEDMAMEARKMNEETRLRKTTQKELGSLIQEVTQDIVGGGTGPWAVDDESWEPHFITASDMVRRMRPFLVYN